MLQYIPSLLSIVVLYHRYILASRPANEYTFNAFSTILLGELPLDITDQEVVFLAIIFWFLQWRRN
jgi:hypothetical protein